MRNNLQFTLSVQNNSPKIIGSSEETFHGIRNNSLIKIGDNDELYTIKNRERFFFIKPFILQDSRTLIVNEDIGQNLQIGDSIKITYKEYELNTIVDIINSGSEFFKEENLTIEDENAQLSMDISSGMGFPTILTVSQVNETGGISQLGVIEKGKYLVHPKNPIKIKDATIELNYSEINNRALTERTVASINIKDNQTYLMLDYSLPPNLKEGKLSVEKSILVLDRPYNGPTQNNLSYKIFHDFTPHLNIPLMAKNTLSPDILYNRGMMILDQKIKELENKLNKN